MSEKERSGWRDQRISERHRTWGDCYASDIDFVLAEYTSHNGRIKVCALIEYKQMRAKPQNPKHQNYIALRILCNEIIPFFACRYDLDVIGGLFIISPLNKLAKTIQTKIKFNEIQYVEFLHLLRGKTIPIELKERLEWLADYEKAWGKAI